ncbi:MAG TPA: ABC transporter permease [Pseudobacteroides sp.]|uniref:ABC transporter permease n=1 Tax=Pseudobacteroides sp. TaxID=1968840 RepID=UPI002F9273A5
MVFSAKVAMRFLKSGKSQTIFIALGIAIGVSVQIFIGLLIQGLQQSLINRTIGNSPQITVTSLMDNKLIEDWESLFDRVMDEKRVEKISPVADSAAFIKYNSKSEPVVVRGFLPDKADEIYNIKERIFEGELFTGDREVLVGKELRDKLGLMLGQEVEIITYDGKKAGLKVKGFYDLKVSSINKSWLMVSLKTSQDILGFDNSITGIEMQVGYSDVFNTKEIAKSIDNLLNHSNLKTDEWQSQNAELLSGLNGQSVSSIMIQVFVLVSVLLGIASVLAITVMQKSKQIGILKAMGVKDRQSSMIFMLQGFFLGILGSVLGVSLGLGLIVMFTKFALNPDGTPVVPIYMNYGFITFSGVIAVAASVAASLIPARKSSKLNPIEVIRNG